MANEVKCPTTTEMSRLEACPILRSSLSACQSFHWRRTLGPRRPVSEKDRPNSSKIPESRDSTCVFSTSTWAPFNTVFPTFLACGVGTNRSEVVDVDRQHADPHVCLLRCALASCHCPLLPTCTSVLEPDLYTVRQQYVSFVHTYCRLQAKGDRSASASI